MKSSKVLAILTFFVLLTPAFAQIRVVQATVPFDFVVNNQAMPAGEYRLSLNGAGALRIARTTGNTVTGIIGLPVVGNSDPSPRLLFHRYGNRNFLAEVCVGETGRRLVPMSARVFEILRIRCDARQEGWVFPSKRSASICNLFRKARSKAGLPKELVLYCARHDCGTRVLMRTGNLAAVMRTMGHRDVKTAMQYQHPELEIVRAALDYRPPTSEISP